MLKVYFTLLLLTSLRVCDAQDYRWQQRVEYVMNVSLDVASGKMSGTQKLSYYNNSPDTLTKVYYHLYFNAFQPGSMMDVRSRNLPDPDRRILDRISKLTDSEIGYQHILQLEQDGKATVYSVQGTILEVTLARPLLPHSKTVFDMKFESQVPKQIRRSGRNNTEGIAYTMTQWYPKMAEYDFQGWHAYQYIGREFHGVWGDFDVTINIDRSFIIGGTGVLQNPEQVGHGYEPSGMKLKLPEGNLTWHFIAKNVIDFAWAADPDYTHDVMQMQNGPELHFFYQKNRKTAESWKTLEAATVKAFGYLNEHFGKYTLPAYSVIQGGDGGTEYPMCMMIMGEGTANGSIGLMVHELAHSWFQMALASNESVNAWMNEGFAQYAGHEAEGWLLNIENPHAGSYAGYFALVASGLQEPASQASDHYNTTKGYQIASYEVGAIFLNQLSYIIGKENFNKGMLRYYNAWKMRHPEPNDFIRIMEKTSGLQLQWYLRYWIGTTKRIDYGITAVTDNDKSTDITLQRTGDLPMPLDVVISYNDGTKELYYIPMNELLGNKPQEDKTLQQINSITWPWVNPTYVLSIPKRKSAIKSIEIDPSLRMADINRRNNKWPTFQNP